MTVSSSTNRVSYAGNSSTTIFPYTYKIFDQDDLTVILRAADGGETVKTLTSDYTVSGVGSAGGGNVTMLVAPASGETLVILREQPLVQELDIVPNDPFPAESLEAALDKLTFMVQQHEETLDRSLKVSRTTTIATSEFTDTPAQRAGKFLGFDGSGNLSVASTTDSSITVSAYIENFLIAADSASAFAALGVTATNTELNILDGVTASTAEINLLDGVTASTAELNILDGVTADATEINYLDGKTLSGLDTEIITGTAGSSGDIVQWNADGDLVSYGAATQLQATWEAGTGTTESLVSPAKIKAAIDAAIYEDGEDATTSGTSHDFTSIPAGMNEIQVMLNDVGLSGSDNVLIQIGTGGSPTTSGYISSSTRPGNAPTATNGFIISLANSSYAVTGPVFLSRIPGTNSWVSSHAIILDPTLSTNIITGGGRVTLSGVLDNIRLTRTGSDTFDEGGWSIRCRK